MNKTANNLFFFIPLHLCFREQRSVQCVSDLTYKWHHAHPEVEKKKRQTTASEQRNVYSLPPAVRKHDFTSFLFPEFIRTLHKFTKVQTPFFVSLEACIIYSWHAVYMTHLQLNDLCPRSDFHTPACCFGHKATWQHRSSQSAQDQRKERNTQKWKKNNTGRKWVPRHCGCKTHVLYPASSPLPTHGPKLWCWCCPPLLVAPRGADVSHGEGDEAVVSLDVPLEDLWAWPQHALKAGSVQLHALERTAGDYGGCPGAVQQQGDFTWRRRMRRRRERGQSAGASLNVFHVCIVLSVCENKLLICMICVWMRMNAV